MRLKILMSALALLALALACSSTTKTEGGATCVPSEQKACLGANSCDGRQTCNEQGSAFSTCQCVAGGSGGSAGGGAGGGSGSGGAGGGGTGSGGTGASGGSSGSGGSASGGGAGTGGSSGTADAASDALVCSGQNVSRQTCVNAVTAAGLCQAGADCSCVSCACQTMDCMQDPGCTAIVSCVLTSCPNTGDPACMTQYCGQFVSQYQSSLNLVALWSDCTSQASCSCGSP
jgi:hypothetical protein